MLSRCRKTTFHCRWMKPWLSTAGCCLRQGQVSVRIDWAPRRRFESNNFVCQLFCSLLYGICTRGGLYAVIELLGIMVVCLVMSRFVLALCFVLLCCILCVFIYHYSFDFTAQQGLYRYMAKHLHGIHHTTERLLQLPDGILVVFLGRKQEGLPSIIIGRGQRCSTYNHLFVFVEIASK